MRGNMGSIRTVGRIKKDKQTEMKKQMMTKKHFSAIAEVLRKQKKEIRKNYGAHMPIHSAQFQLLYTITTELMAVFEKENPRFDSLRFFQAVNKE